MKKILFTIFLSVAFCNTGFTESYYFKECKLSENASGDYLIDFDKNVIRVNLKTIDGITQKLTDKIKLITKDQIVSDIIQNKTNKKYYLQYNLNIASKSIIRQRYIKKVKMLFYYQLVQKNKLIVQMLKRTGTWKNGMQIKKKRLKLKKSRKKVYR